LDKFLCVLGIFDEETQQVLGEYQRAVLAKKPEAEAPFSLGGMSSRGGEAGI